jgi:thioredoxin-like negative regulator of GroEL
LAALAEQHPQVKLRRVDVGDWQSPVALQYGIRQLPTLWLYEDGELVSKDGREVAARLSRLK